MTSRYSPTTPLLVVLVGLLMPSLARAQVYDWCKLPEDKGALALLENGRQIGIYYILEDSYRAMLPGGGWSSPMQSPIAPPKRNFGVQERKLHGGDHYTLNGRSVERKTIEQALQESGVTAREVEDRKIPDDSTKPRITVIGSKEQTQQVLKDFQGHESLRPFKDRFLVRAYEPTHWSIQRQGFSTRGNPTIYVQAPDGTVLHRQNDYQGGAEELAKALRQIDPEYRPDRDRDRRRLLPLLKLGNVPWSFVVVGTLSLFVVIYFRRK